MNANSKLLCKIVLFAICLLASYPLYAGDMGTGAAGAMYNVKEVLLQYPRFRSEGAADHCGLARADLMSPLVKSLKNSGVPAFLPIDSMPAQIGVARIEVLPDISTINDGETCTSWISLSAQNDVSLSLAPIETQRNLVVTYWQKGVLINSSTISHVRAVSDVLLGLGGDFAYQYRVDQPSGATSLPPSKP